MNPPIISVSPVPHTHRYHDKYVVTYDFSNVDKKTAVKEFNTLLQDLHSVGLQTEVRAGYEQCILVFVKASRQLLGNTVYKSRVKDWLYGITTQHPGGTNSSAVDGQFEAEDILSMYHLVTWSKEQGGAGITPGFGQWENVSAAFPLHNEEVNQKLLKQLSQRFILRKDDLDNIRNLFGSKVAFYFAFIQTYLVFLIFPAATGLVAWLFMSRFSLAYAILTCVWCTVFLEYWKIQEVDLSIRWNVRGIGKVKGNRPEYRWEQVIIDDAGRKIHYYPRWKRIALQFLQIPFAILAIVALGIIIIGVFAFEVLISEAYSGPFKSVLGFIPTIVLALILPQISGSLEGIATFLTNLENHRTADVHEMSLTLKRFALSIITNYLPILITAFVYIPFGEDFVPRLRNGVRTLLGALGQQYFTEGEFIDISSDKLIDEVVALTLTGQVSSFMEENVIPVAKRKFWGWYRDYRASRSDTISMASDLDDPAEAAFLRKARVQATLEHYNVQDDIAEIVLQFGYLALFSPVWPLISIGFLINNIVELRTDFLKITTEQQRPAPVRSDGIGAWVACLEFLTWAGSISTGAVVHLFAGTIANGAWWALPITIFISEHIFTAFRSMVRFMLQRISSEQIRKESQERYALRAKHLQEMQASSRLGGQLSDAERQRRKSVALDSGEIFFTKQVEDGASAEVGLALIKRHKTNVELGAEQKLD